MGHRTPGSALSRWKTRAVSIRARARQARPPLSLLYEEALDLARFHARYWKTERDASGRVVRRGLEQAVRPNAPKDDLNEATGSEIVSLVEAAQEAHVAYLLWTEPLPNDQGERGLFVLSELTAALEWLFEERLEGDEAEANPPVGAQAEEPETVDELVRALEEYAKLAEPYRRELDRLGGFDASLIDEAHELAATLWARSLESMHSADAASALALRGKIVDLLLGRMDLVRAAARFVFRREPEILREAMSTYRPPTRARARRAAASRVAALAAVVEGPHEGAGARASSRLRRASQGP